MVSAWSIAPVEVESVKEVSLAMAVVLRSAPQTGRPTPARLSTLIRGILVLALVTTAASARTPRPEPDSAVGAYARLSPRQQRIVEALFRAQRAAAANGMATAPTPLTRDQIAGMKTAGYGWQQIFGQMKAAGLVQDEDLRQLMDKYYHVPRRPTEAG